MAQELVSWVVCRCDLHRFSSRPRLEWSWGRVCFRKRSTIDQNRNTLLRTHRGEGGQQIMKNHYSLSLGACMGGPLAGALVCRVLLSLKLRGPPKLKTSPGRVLGRTFQFDKVMGKTWRRMRVPVRGSPIVVVLPCAGFPGQDAELLPGTSS